MTALDISIPVPTAPAAEEWTDKVIREITVIGGGALHGIGNGLKESASHPLELGANLATSAAFMLAMSAPGWIKTPAAAIGLIGSLDFGIHAISKITSALPAIEDLWSTGKNINVDRAVVEQNLGPLAFNVTGMALTGLVAGYVGGRMTASSMAFRSHEVAQFSPATSVVTLGRDNLNAASQAGKAGFNYAADILHPDLDFKASLYPRVYNKMYGKDPHAPIDGKYFLAVGRGKSSVLGTTGLYHYAADKDEAAWLGWFSVRPENRSQGLGKQLLDFSIDQARADDKHFLRLYTSDHPGEAVAQKLYDRAGLKITNIDPPNQNGVRIIYRELDLKPELQSAAKIEPTQFHSAPVTDDSWHEIFESQFPPEERQPYDFLHSLAEDGSVPQVKLQLTQAAGKTQAFSITSDYGDLGGEHGRGLLLPYIAVDGKLQSQGIGGAHLEQMFAEAKANYPTAKGMVIEVEDPQAPGISAEDAAKRQQRIDWYAKHDSHVLDKPYLIPSAEEGTDPLPARLIWRDFDRGGLNNEGLNALIAKIYQHGYELPADHPIVQQVLAS